MAAPLCCLCGENLTNYHAPGCDIGTCGSCAWMPFPEHLHYDHFDENRLLAHFTCKYFGESMCFKCYQALGTNIVAAVERLEILTRKLKQESWLINHRRMKNLQHHINLYKNLDLLIAEYALDL